MSNGAINAFDKKGRFIGKVKLQGKRKCIKYAKNVYDHSTIEGELIDIISGIDYWVKLKS
jgi:hypothetical protein